MRTRGKYQDGSVYEESVSEWEAKVGNPHVTNKYVYTLLYSFTGTCFTLSNGTTKGHSCTITAWVGLHKQTFFAETTRQW